MSLNEQCQEMIRLNDLEESLRTEAIDLRYFIDWMEGAKEKEAGLRLLEIKKDREAVQDSFLMLSAG